MKREEPSPDFGDSRDEILRRAREGGLDVEVDVVERKGELEQTRRAYLSVQIPNGRDKRKAQIDASVADALLLSNFEHCTILGDYVAVLDKSTGNIEASLRAVGRFSMMSRLSRIPGVRRIEPELPLALSDSVEGAADELSEEYVELDRFGLDDDWVLPIRTPKSEVLLEICSNSYNTLVASPSVGRFVRPFRGRSGPCLRIYGTGPNTHDEAVSILEKYSASLFFELDLRFAIPLSISRYDPSGAGSGRFVQRRDSRIDAIENAYAQEAVSMYIYGSSAVGMPLLQYLAYYQTIEFFFPSFANAEVLRRLRLRLRDPLFNKESDSDLQRLAAVARGSLRGGMSEREQLRATLEASVEESDLRDLIQGPVQQFFVKEETLKGVKKLNFRSSGERLLDQIAERIYQIRCRIVHTKEAGGDASADVLLPFGREADSLRNDIWLIRFIAQKVLIAGSRGSL